MKSEMQLSKSDSHNADAVDWTDANAIAAYLEDVASPDGASALESLPTDRAAEVATILDPVTASRIIAQMDPLLAAGVISEMPAPEASMVLSAMVPDDRVDVMEHVTGPLHEELLREMDEPAADNVRRLEQFPPDTAGGMMTTQVTALFEYLTVEDAILLLRKLNQELEQMYYVYVVNRREHLVGVLSMRDLILAKPGRSLREIMIPNVRSVPATMSKEEVAQLMRKYRYLAMPVVDERNKLLGLITVDDIVDVIQDEATADVQKMFGAGAEERLTSPWPLSFKKRVWWLQVNLATAFLAGGVVGLFEGTIEKFAVLAVYMPIVAGMGGNASAQAMAVAVRGISVGRTDRSTVRHVLHRELLVGLLSGLFIGATTALIALLWQRSPALGLVVGVALIINHTLACTTGAGIPFLMRRLGFDPAQSATIFATTVTDIAGFFTLLGLASLFIKWLA
ncbi:MAG: magnesium transporter [Tepidisphaeraceae bacterium]